MVKGLPISRTCWCQQSQYMFCTLPHTTWWSPSYGQTNMVNGHSGLQPLDSRICPTAWTETRYLHHHFKSQLKTHLLKLAVCLRLGLSLAFCCGFTSSTTNTYLHCRGAFVLHLQFSVLVGQYSSLLLGGLFSFGLERFFFSQSGGKFRVGRKWESSHLKMAPYTKPLLKTAFCVTTLLLWE